MTDIPDDQIIKMAAEEVLKKRFGIDDGVTPYICDDDEDGLNLVYNWNPLINANHTNMLIDAVKNQEHLGCIIKTDYCKGGFSIYITMYGGGLNITKRAYSYHKPVTQEEINKTITLVCIEAVRKLEALKDKK